MKKLTLPDDVTYVAICAECGDKIAAHKLTPDELAQVKPGAWVKIKDNCEGFWVKVVSFSDGVTVRGIVDNDLVREHSFKADDPIEFPIERAYQVTPATTTLEGFRDKFEKSIEEVEK